MEKAWDERLYQSIALKRSAFFRPVAALLSKLGVSPNMTTGLGVLLMTGFIWGVGRSPKDGFWFLLAVLICDQLDGAIARYRHADSERGKFIDVIADTTNFSLFTVGLVYAGLLGGATAALLIYFATLSRALGIISKNLARKSDWLFFSGAGPVASTFVYGIYAFFVLVVLAHFSHLQLVAQIAVIGATISSVVELTQILRQA